MKKKQIQQFILSFVIALVIYGALMFAMSAGILDNYWSGILIMACINVVLATSLNLASGYLGQLTLGHAGFMSVGAYVSAILSIYFQMPFIVSLIVGAIAACIIGILIGIPTLRLKGDYLCIITLAFNEIIRVIMLNLNITNGAKGLMGIPMNTDFTTGFMSVAVTIYVIYSIVKSRHGRAIISIREDETASELAGIPTAYYKILAFAISAFFAGLAGGLYAHYMGMLVPKTFDYNKSVEILVMVVLGGLGNLKGSVIAAIVMTILPEYLRAFSEYRMLLYAVVLIAAMIMKEKNVMPRIKAKFAKKRHEEVSEQ
ncbi:branched-chain amino acid ABC transporter permease [Candidatus Stoquefichus massiliensis]|uniref:branched-chain amino acid ABC transporter permease n=1 Tax=Candidatus Stoquefichus massiliensis TaxID=1470350 RepID=UPI0004819D49|nr:branched-chain amino acid ABC transporter permease [Candidatus Stoquefichus massiliensis]